MTVTSQFFTAERIVLSIASPFISSTSLSGCRKSMVKRTSSATEFEVFGVTSMRATVKRRMSSGSVISAFSALMARTMSCTASLRRLSGAVPAWADSPRSSTRNQRLPWMPVTTPMS